MVKMMHENQIINKKNVYTKNKMMKEAFIFAFRDVFQKSMFYVFMLWQLFGESLTTFVVYVAVN